jgi:hypothetical protein
MHKSRDPWDISIAENYIRQATVAVQNAAAMVRAIGCTSRAKALDRLAEKVAAALGGSPPTWERTEIVPFDRSNPAAWIAVGNSIKDARRAVLALCTPLCRVAPVRLWDRISAQVSRVDDSKSTLENEMFRSLGNDNIDGLIDNPLYVFYGDDRKASVIRGA